MSRLAILGGEPVRQRPFPHWPQHTEADARRLQQVLESGNWGGYPFPNTLADEFSRQFAAFHGARYGCAVANGTIALVAALQAGGIRFGDEVIVPAYTWDGTAAAVLFAGGVPVFADIDPDTYCLDVEQVRQAVTPRTRAVIPVHLAMRFVDMDALLAVAAQHRLAVIEDCAHAHGGQYNGRGAGSMGDAGCFSFQSSKLMTAGEGGAVITSRLDLFELVQSCANCGRASATDQFGRRVVGSNYRITEFQAALLLGQLERLPELAARRARHAALLTAALAAIPGVRPLPAQPALTRDTIYNYVFQYRPEDQAVSRDLFVAALDAEGIPCDGRFYEAVYRSDLFPARADDFPQLKLDRDRPVDYRECRCPVAERAAYEESVWLPQFLLLGDEQDIQDIARAVAKVMTARAELAQAAPGLAGLKGMSRADRPRFERERNY
ncbi:MAG: DegT/DnrJ/EryC1/StrS family aminotransferase [Acidobacteria bacterium]|nr:DegT/DnrJ/EryC1/StrS family aminotransferase [Acidobacteriota bacterium]